MFYWYASEIQSVFLSLEMLDSRRCLDRHLGVHEQDDYFTFSGAIAGTVERVASLVSVAT